MERKNSKERKRKRFHQVLLNLYHPPSPPRSSPSRSPQLSEDELVAAIDCGNMELNFDQGDEINNRSENSVAHVDDVETKKLTRAQRKRLRKRKLKEASSVRRKIIGPLLPSTNQDVQDPSEKILHENPCEPG